MPGDNWCLGDGRAAEQQQEPGLSGVMALAVGGPEPAGAPEPEPEPRLPTPLEMRNELTELFAAHSGAAAFTVDYWGARLFFRATEGVVLGQLGWGQVCEQLGASADVGLTAEQFAMLLGDDAETEAKYIAVFSTPTTPTLRLTGLEGRHSTPPAVQS